MRFSLSPPLFLLPVLFSFCSWFWWWRWFRFNLHLVSLPLFPFTLYSPLISKGGNVDRGEAGREEIMRSQNVDFRFCHSSSTFSSFPPHLPSSFFFFLFLFSHHSVLPFLLIQYSTRFPLRLIDTTRLRLLLMLTWLCLSCSSLNFDQVFSFLIIMDDGVCCSLFPTSIHSFLSFATHASFSCFHYCWSPLLFSPLISSIPITGGEKRGKNRRENMRFSSPSYETRWDEEEGKKE